MNAHKVRHDKAPEDWEEVEYPRVLARPVDLGAVVFYGLDSFLEQYGLDLDEFFFPNSLTESENSGKVKS